MFIKVSTNTLKSKCPRGTHEKIFTYLGLMYFQVHSKNTKNIHRFGRNLVQTWSLIGYAFTPNIRITHLMASEIIMWSPKWAN